MASNTNVFPTLNCILDISATYLSDALEYLNLIFLAELPLEVLYLEALIDTLRIGFYIGIYGIISRTEFYQRFLVT
jgi:hypothetical protein